MRAHRRAGRGEQGLILVARRAAGRPASVELVVGANRGRVDGRAVRGAPGQLDGAVSARAAAA